ncbi:MAG: hypothetical protein A2Y56_04790 [Candidatus Aminicenantes bacterium RBG_13_63_10]|nr:MAG: hypothetical protein A2Y56_04790 [Candidatus Aminicenantes bacterium RBG_13_63_10]
MKKALLWVLAFLITLAAAVFQRMTGPSYPVSGRTVVGGETVAFRLDRSALTTRDMDIKLKVPAKKISGYVRWKRFKSDDLPYAMALERRGDELFAALPRQPMAGKLEYRVFLQDVSLTGEKPVVVRFRGSVPGWLLIPHILVMFLAMLFSNRAGLAALDGREKTRPLVLWTLALLFLGGFILGPLVQKFSFGMLWSGFPLGFDLTDNKTLIAFVVWAAAAIVGRGGRKARGWIIAAAAVTLAVYLIPHSLLGSELKVDRPK